MFTKTISIVTKLNSEKVNVRAKIQQNKCTPECLKFFRAKVLLYSSKTFEARRDKSYAGKFHEFKGRNFAELNLTKMHFVKGKFGSSIEINLVEGNFREIS